MSDLGTLKGARLFVGLVGDQSGEWVEITATESPALDMPVITFTLSTTEPYVPLPREPRQWTHPTRPDRNIARQGKGQKRRHIGPKR